MKLLLPVPGGLITGRFSDPSKSNPANIHAGLDVAPRTSRSIIAPESGETFAWISHRQADGNYWPQDVKIGGRSFPFLNYFYDMYGGVVVLRTPERTHLFCHLWANVLFDEYGGWDWIEEQAEKRWPIFGIVSSSVVVQAGEQIGHVGNAGFSTGAHLHWEIHHGYTLNKREDRIDPEKHLAGRNA